MSIKINSITGQLLFESNKETLKEAVIEAVEKYADLRFADLQFADLRDAYLRGVDLRGADLRGVDLRDAYLQGVDLRDADLRGVDLRGAYLRGVDLRGAYLQGAKINWQFHALVSELLRQAAEDDVEKRKIAGLVAISTDWCWDKFLALNDPLHQWAIDVLSQYVQDDDNAPALLRDYKRE